MEQPQNTQRYRCTKLVSPARSCMAAKPGHHTHNKSEGKTTSTCTTWGKYWTSLGESTATQYVPSEAATTSQAGPRSLELIFSIQNCPLERDQLTTHSYAIKMSASKTSSPLPSTSTPGKMPPRIVSTDSRDFAEGCRQEKLALAQQRSKEVTTFGPAYKCDICGRVCLSWIGPHSHIRRCAET